MKISDKGLSLIREFESFSGVPYMCPAKKLTIGYGHVILPYEAFSRINKEQANEILRKDCAIAESTIHKCVKAPLSQNQFDALISLVFNIGSGNFLSSTLLKRLNEEDYEGAANNFQKWVFSGKTRLKGLERRRAAEWKLFTESES